MINSLDGKVDSVVSQEVNSILLTSWFRNNFYLYKRKIRRTNQSYKSESVDR